MQDIIERNGLKDGNVLRVGLELIIREADSPSARQLPTVSPQTARPDGSVLHVVQYGETLFAIANTYGVRMQDIIQRNRLKDGAVLRVGLELIIRGAP